MRRGWLAAGGHKADHYRHAVPSGSRDGASALEGWNTGPLDFLFIENVGNLVCPSSYDLGEDLRLVLLSVTEGEDKPLKYPTIFNSSDVAILTKMDLAEVVEFDEEMANRNIQAVRPGMKVFKVSAKSGEGMNECLKFLAGHRTARHPTSSGADNRHFASAG